MPKDHGSGADVLLAAIGEATGFFSWPPEGGYTWIRQQYRHRKSAYNTLRRLEQQGLVCKRTRGGKWCYSLTEKGLLEILMYKAHPDKHSLMAWDGSWRLVFFDIPEEHKTERDKLRKLLLEYGYKKMQGSVYVGQRPLNREAIEYLKGSGYIRFIRLARIAEFDDDSELRKMFGHQ